MPISPEIKKLIDSTPFIDTHEHLAEESDRLAGTISGPYALPPIRDFSIFFTAYARYDLTSAGLPNTEVNRLYDLNLDLRDKWKIIAPFYEKSYNTGFMQNIRESIRILFQEEDLREDNFRVISDKLNTLLKPGYYQRVIKDLSQIAYCQVNSLQNRVFLNTENPELLAQDMSFWHLSVDLRIEEISRQESLFVRHLKDWHRCIDHCFEKYAKKAIALKNQAAYDRPLNFEKVSEQEASPYFDQYLRNPQKLEARGLKAIQDHLFHYCLNKAREYRLPVKLHTGYLAGNGHMLLHPLRHHAGDVSELLKSYPDIDFVLMHIFYPYENEAIALAKHFPNAYIDLCWAWIINPLVCVRFVKEFLSAAPANKLFTFGGDYMIAELIPGHARMARQGLTQAFSELAGEGWLEKNDLEKTIKRVMWQNAHKVFRYEDTLKYWKNVR